MQPTQPNPSDVQMLIEAFERFSGAGETVTRAYRELQTKVDELDTELDAKNRELATNLAEKDRLTAYLRKVLESMGEGILVVGADERVEMANAAAADLFGKTANEVKGRALADVLKSVFADESIAKQLVRRDGRVREGEFRLVEGEGARMLRVRCHPLTGREGVATGRILVLEDVTDEARTKAQSARTQRLAAMGDMAVKIVHEVRNPMGSIELVASLLARDLDSMPASLELVQRIQSGIRSMNLIIDNLLSFARDTQPRTQNVDMPTIVDQCLEAQIHLLHTQKIDADHRRPEGEDVRVRGDGALLQQVFMNLVLNAAQAMTTGGNLTVEYRPATLESNGEEKAAWRVLVKDTGVGMSAETRERVFHPFFTTKERGTGLGLALCHNIIQAHGGRIDVESEPGRGTTFAVTLAAWTDGADAKPGLND